ncbi:kelch repeat-containing protein [Parabacteroides sp. PF5-6]|uniref:Kelch repeat-containing protein n=1 Tax=Parabacteroides sp. PF5-6 TaxID=1742403 RepID=UPI002406D7A8|nr:kelch repeat-containing protein [Parabacteroides sp. PF5-6]MDF9829434.1 N-acetylneuraminic acid mutarotase [Parabacteroides sp. PF5-6]
MKGKKWYLSLFLSLPLVICSCSDEDDEYDGKWHKRSDFDGKARRSASGFTIGNKGYVVGGYDGTNPLTDVWAYDIDRDAWTQKAHFPGEARHSADAFTINDKGYYGTGYYSSTYYNDFWEYDPATNNWTQKASFPGSGRYGSVSFTVGGKGFMGGGYDGNYLKDFYAYNPSADSWTQIVSIGGSKRMGANSFVINDIAYVVGGENNGSYVTDFWKYDAQADSWTELREIKDDSDEDYDDEYDIARKYGNTFVIDDVAYYCCGDVGSLRSNVWKYYPNLDLWDHVRAFKGSARTEAVSFSTGERGFVVTGRSGTSCFDDVWELKPYEYDDDEY